MVKTSDDDKKIIDLMARHAGGRNPLSIDVPTDAPRRNKHSSEDLTVASKAFDLLQNILVDETLPFYLASLTGVVLHVNDHYKRLDRTLGEASLAPGNANIAKQYEVPTMKSVIDDVLASETTVRSEEIRQVGERERIFLGRHMPVRNTNHEIVAIAGTYEDVTAYVRGVEVANVSQARFQDFARASSDWFFECDAELRVRSLSERFTALVGQPASLFIGSRFDQFGSLEKNIEGKVGSLNAQSSRKPFRDQLFVINSPAGEELKFHLSGVPVFNSYTGKFDGYRGVGMDVTARYQHEEEQAAARERMEELFEELTQKNGALDIANERAMSALTAKNEFIAAMSHELRTPLNAIIGFAEAFERRTFGKLTAAYGEYATDIRTSGEHLLGLIDDILDVAVIESGGLSLQVAEHPARQIVDNAILMNLEAAVNKKLDTSGLKSPIDCCLNVDERRATQILVNLISNAIKFTPVGGAIGIECDVCDDANVKITVWDTGVGISDDQHMRIFEKFHQVTDNIYSREQEGAGLGLHISRELSRRMQGDLTVESTVGEGSRFTVTLPLADKA